MLSTAEILPLDVLVYQKQYAAYLVQYTLLYSHVHYAASNFAKAGLCYLISPEVRC